MTKNTEKRKVEEAWILPEHPELMGFEALEDAFFMHGYGHQDVFYRAYFNPDTLFLILSRVKESGADSWSSLRRMDKKLSDILMMNVTAFVRLALHARVKWKDGVYHPGNYDRMTALKANGWAEEDIYCEITARSFLKIEKLFKVNLSFQVGYLFVMISNLLKDLCRETGLHPYSLDKEMTDDEEGTFLEMLEGEIDPETLITFQDMVDELYGKMNCTDKEKVRRNLGYTSEHVLFVVRTLASHPVQLLIHLRNAMLDEKTAEIVRFLAAAREKGFAHALNVTLHAVARKYYISIDLLLDIVRDFTPKNDKLLTAADTQEVKAEVSRLIYRANSRLYADDTHLEIPFRPSELI